MDSDQAGREHLLSQEKAGRLKEGLACVVSEGRKEHMRTLYMWLEQKPEKQAKHKQNKTLTNNIC